MAATDSGQSTPITIKKYANRRLYNTATSSYVTLEHLCAMVKEGAEFVVYDAKTGEDITRTVLTQIIVEEENKGPHLLPISFLRQLIGLYGHSMQAMVPGYLDYSMQAFARNQEKMRDYVQGTLGGMFPFGSFEEMNKQNLAIFERAMRMFTPFGGLEPARLDGESSETAAARTAGGTSSRTIEALEERVDDLQRQIAALGAQKAEATATPTKAGGAGNPDAGD